MSDLSTATARKQVEEWRAIPDWEGFYDVSDLGRVRSVKRLVPGGNGSRAVRGGRILKPSLTHGYEHVTLSREDVQTSRRIHALVLTAFVGPRPSGMHGCHNDGDSRNNALSNLRWDTPKSNSADREVHGTARRALKRGTCPHGHKWTAENTYLYSNGTPRCRTCHREDQRARNGRQAA